MKKIKIIAGPCAIESEEQIVRIAIKLKEIGIDYLRGGAFKPRTSPYSFQGLGDLGIEYLLKAKEVTGLPVVTELMSIEQVRKYADKIDVIQIGSRNMYNYELLKELGKYSKTVLLKRGFSATYEEWISAAKYINGGRNVILCERGIRWVDKTTRNVLDIQSIPYIKNNTDFVIYIDPSHSSGKSYMIESMSLASVVAGCDGLMIEVHDKPEESFCDSEQAIDINKMKDIMNKIRELEKINI